jgi:hypothetical protein
LIFSFHAQLEDQSLAPELIFEPLKRFPKAIVDDENYVIYNVKRRGAE